MVLETIAVGGSYGLSKSGRPGPGDHLRLMRVFYHLELSCFYSRPNEFALIKTDITYFEIVVVNNYLFPTLMPNLVISTQPFCNLIRFPPLSTEFPDFGSFQHDRLSLIKRLPGICPLVESSTFFSFFGEILFCNFSNISEDRLN